MRMAHGVDIVDQPNLTTDTFGFPIEIAKFSPRKIISDADLIKLEMTVAKGAIVR